MSTETLMSSWLSSPDWSSPAGRYAGLYRLQQEMLTGDPAEAVSAA